MRTESAGKFTKGTRVYNVARCADDGKLHLWIYEIKDIIVTYTPSGKPRKPIYRAECVNCYVGKDSKTEIDIDPKMYCDSAVNAVNVALRNYFDKKCTNNTSPEERLMASIFGEKPNPHVAATELVDVIYDLKNFHSLFAEAFKLDEAKVQAIQISEEESANNDKDKEER